MAPEPEEGKKGNERGRSECRSASICEGQRTTRGKDREQRRKSAVRHARRSGEHHARKGDGAGNVWITEEAKVSDSVVPENETSRKSEYPAGESEHHPNRYAPEQA